MLHNAQDAGPLRARDGAGLVDLVDLLHDLERARGADPNSGLPARGTADVAAWAANVGHDRALPVGIGVDEVVTLFHVGTPAEAAAGSLVAAQGPRRPGSCPGYVAETPLHRRVGKM